MKKKNLVGERFGMLTVEKLSDSHGNRHLKWDCICECGNRSTHTGNNLRCGHAKSCGCLKRKPQREDLSNMKFGKLFVKDFNKTKNGVAFWNCKCSCGASTIVSSGHLKSGHTQSCGCIASEAAKKRAYKTIAGKKKTSINGSLKPRIAGGYVKIHDRNHHRADNSGFVYEHIVVMEKHLKRSLLPKETVHHKNGMKTDNRIENLELWSHSHPCGQRIADKIAWAKEILATYNGDA